jgi:UDP-N-acetylmuramate--alanine ligase
MGLREIRQAHFIAIGGVGMSGIAWVWLQHGIAISGSDLAANPMTQRLAEHGARCYIGHDPANLDGAEVVVVSTAIRADNCELLEAQRRGLPIWHRSKALNAIMAEGRSVAIAGTHGKTTTTALAGLIFENCGCDPTVVVGGESANFGGTAKVGRSPWIISELDESDGTFLGVQSDHLLITNIESDHLDHYGNYDGLIRAFQDYAGRVRRSVVACGDDPGVRRAIESVGRPMVRYSISDRSADYAAANIRLEIHESRFDLLRKGERVGEVVLSAPGLHNVSNATGALGLAIEAGLDPLGCCGALGNYNGVGRRLTIKGEVGGVLIVDDYAHHPSEISATLAVGRDWARSRGGRLICVFQPHRYTRTATLGSLFGPAFKAADRVIITGIYPAGERPIEGVTGRVIADSAIAAGQAQVQYIPDRDAVADALAPEMAKGDVFMTLGAGDVWKIGDSLRALYSSPDSVNCRV